MQRRAFCKLSLVTAAALCSELSATVFAKQPRDNQPLSPDLFPQKDRLIVHSDRPPLLESPRSVFRHAITPNSQFFVRWHMPVIPTATNLDTYYLHVHGAVNKRLYLTVEQLKKEFTPKEVTAVMQCGGNSRSAFVPTTSGIQWGSGAMGCATFKGVALKDILKRAGLDANATWIGLRGGDRAVMSKIEDFQRELKISEIGDDVIVAYAMNGEEIPFLNGYPLRLIIPGLYADSWVKMLSDIYVTKEYQPYFYMDVAYRIPDNSCECELPNALAKKTKPLEKMNVKSFIGKPCNKEQIALVDKHLEIEGVAFDGGSGIKEVLISVDGGKHWERADLQKAASNYAFHKFSYRLDLKEKGSLSIMAKAVAHSGEEQPFAHEVLWNHGGYKYNGMDRVTIDVV